MIQAGDRVRIKNFTKQLNGELGVVAYRDGYYVYVFPDCQPDNNEYPCELYDNELEIVENAPPPPTRKPVRKKRSEIDKPIKIITETLFQIKDEDRKRKAFMALEELEEMLKDVRRY